MITPYQQRLRSLGMALGAVGFLMCAIMAITDKGTFMKSYVFGWTFLSILVIGSFSLTLLHHITQARWSMPLMRMFEAGGSTTSFILLAVGFLPIALSMHDIYPWTHADHIDAVIKEKQWWLDQNRFLIRQVIYFAFWIFLSMRLRAWSVAEDKSGDVGLGQKRKDWSSVGMVVHIILCSLAYTDWIMSLDPHWFSTIFGAWFVVNGALTTLALAVTLFNYNASHDPYRSWNNPDTTKDHGNMLLALTMFWTYLTLSQFLITWSANLPEFIPYYHIRSQPGWNVAVFAVVFGGFFVPFLALLAPTNKRVSGRLRSIATWIFIVHIIDVFVIVIPFFRGMPFTSAIVGEVGSLLLLGGAWAFIFVQELAKAALVPSHEVRTEEIMEEAIENA